jgi:N-formylglutamate deformylase
MQRPTPPVILPGSESPVRAEDPEGGARTPLVFASPHSGRGVPVGFLSLLRPPSAALRRSEDAYVDRLFGCAPGLGAPLVAARFARAYVDANREPAEIDPAMLDGPAPHWANLASPRVANGLGVTPRLTVDGETIHRRRLALAEVEERIARFHAPYHAAIAQRVDSAQRRFGLAVLVDCHSMPAGENRPTPDIVLGDRFGASCHPAVADAAERAFVAQGFSVQRNVPYAGGYTTAHYGRPRRGIHAIQFEVSRALYLEEATVQPLPGAFEALTARLEAVVADLTAIDWAALLRGRRGETRLAAE